MSVAAVVARRFLLVVDNNSLAEEVDRRDLGREDRDVDAVRVDGRLFFSPYISCDADGPFARSRERAEPFLDILDLVDDHRRSSGSLSCFRRGVDMKRFFEVGQPF